MIPKEHLHPDENGNSPYYVMWTYKDLEGIVHDCVTQALSRETAERFLEEVPGSRLMTEQIEVDTPTKAQFGLTWD